MDSVLQTIRTCIRWRVSLLRPVKHSFLRYWCALFRWVYCSSMCKLWIYIYLLGTLGSCSNGDCKGHKNVKRAISSLLNKENNNFARHVQCAFWFFSLLPLHVHDIRLSYATYPYLVPFISCCYVLTWTLKKCWNTLCDLLLGWQLWECGERAYFCQFIHLLCKVSWAKRDYLFWLFILYRRLSMTFHHM